MTEWNPEHPDGVDEHIRAVLGRLERPVDVEAVSQSVRARFRRRRKLRRVALSATVAVLALVVLVGALTFHLGTAGTDVNVLSPVSLPTTKPATTPPSAVVVAVPQVTRQDYGPASSQVVDAGLNPDFALAHSTTVAAGLVAAQSPVGGSAVASGSTVTLTVSIGPSGTAGVAFCRAKDLSLQPGPRVSEASGQETGDWVLTNTSDAACQLNGYPTVSLADGTGRVLGFGYTHGGDQMTTGAAPAPVYLPPQAKAWFRTNKYRCDISIEANSASLTLSVPGDSATLRTPYSLPYCQEAPSLTIAVSPFEAIALQLSPYLTGQPAAGNG